MFKTINSVTRPNKDIEWPYASGNKVLIDKMRDFVQLIKSQEGVTFSRDHVNDDDTLVTNTTWPSAAARTAWIAANPLHDEWYTMRDAYFTAGGCTISEVTEGE